MFVALATPANTPAAGLAFVPGAKITDVQPDGPDLSVLVWNLPGGLLVADRLAPSSQHRFGVPFEPTFAQADWFLIRPPRSADSSPAITAQLEVVGKVHYTSDRAWVVEVPQANLTMLHALDLRREQIPLDAPPIGWDRVWRVLGAPAAAKDLATKSAFVGAVTQDSIFQTIREITGATTFMYGGIPRTVTTRYYHSQEKALAADYLASRLESWGYDVAFQPFVYNGVNCRNVVATKYGLLHPEEYLVVGAHYDAYARDSTTIAPGAEDNASGTSLVVELARITAERDLDRSVQFVLFDAEEVGTVGSSYFVNDAVSSGRLIVGAIIHDMVAYHQAHFAVRIEGQTAWEWLMEAMATNVSSFTTMDYQKDYDSGGSDHVRFQQAGIAAFQAIDLDADLYRQYHMTTDTWSAIATTAPIATQICRASAATIADVAGLLPYYISGTGDTPLSPRTVMTAAPNPFNPQVTISFNLDFAAAGELAVFDLAGRRVRLLAAGVLAAGTHEYIWDGRDANGFSQPSGSYLCRLALPDNSAVVPLSVVR